MSDIIYQASVYSRTISYTNFNGETKETTLHFALDPLALMQVIAGFNPRASKSGNPALKGKEELTDADQIKFILDLASKAAGFPSEDGESWEPHEGFANKLAGKAFMTKLTSSDGDRKEFAQKVIIDPFAAFVGYAESDPGNAPKDIQQFKAMLGQLENIFSEKESNESLEDRRARLAAELAAMDTSEGS